MRSIGGFDRPHPCFCQRKNLDFLVLKNILITGATGLLGRHLSTALISEGTQVFAVGREQSPRLAAGLNYQVLDLGGDWSEKDLPREIDAVIHLAQSTKFRDFPDSALDVFRVNIDSTARLLDYAKQAGAKKFIYASSGGVYGNGRSAFHENSPIVPPGQLGYYLGSKMCGEILVQSYAGIFTVIVLRFFFMYGPGQNRNMLIPRLMDNIKAGRPVSLQGPEGIRINPIHVRDAVTAVMAAIETQESATFNISGPDILSIGAISRAMGKFLNTEPQFHQIPGAPQDLIGDNTAMKQSLVAPSRRLVDHFDDVNAILT